MFDDSRQLSIWQHAGGSRAPAAVAERLNRIAGDEGWRRADGRAAKGDQPPWSRRRQQRGKDGGSRSRDGGSRSLQRSARQRPPREAPDEDTAELPPPRCDPHGWQPPLPLAHRDASGIFAGKLLRGSDVPSHAWIVLRALKDAGEQVFVL